MMRILAVSLLLPLAAAAQPAAALAPSKTSLDQPSGRTVDMTVLLHDENGAPATECIESSSDGKSCVKTEPLTAGRAIARAMFNGCPDESVISADQKWARGALAMRIKEDKAAELTAEEMTTLKKCVGNAYSPLIVMQLFPLIGALLDPNPQPPKVQ